MTNKKGIDISEIVSLYQLGYTSVQIAEKFNCGISNITRRLKKAGVSVIRDYSKGRYCRIGRYSLNEDYFNEINIPEKAYFLGLMFSDGSVTDSGIYLKMKDEDILLKFKNALQAEQPVKKIYYGGYEAYIIQLYSKRLAASLSSFGCTKNKTRTIRFPNIPKEFYSHFIRGFFDGDGCLILNKELGKTQFNITSASKQFLEELNPIISKVSGTKGGISKETKYEVWHLRFCGKAVQTIMNWLYQDATVYLQRKYRKYLMIGSH